MDGRQWEGLDVRGEGEGVKGARDAIVTGEMDHNKRVALLWRGDWRFRYTLWMSRKGPT